MRSRIVQDLYDRAGYDLRLDYAKAAVPPVSAEDEEWARGRIAEAGK